MLRNPARTRRRIVICLAVLVVSTFAGSLGPADAQSARELFKKVAPSVVVIRARGRDVTAGGETGFSETGSGVLISADGKVMTAAHVVHAMDQVSVEFLGGETVAARIVGSEPAADLSLLQLERVPVGAKVAPMADSRTMEVGDPSFGWLQEVASPLERRPGFEWLPEAGVIIGILAIVVGFYLRRVTGLLQVVETVRIGAHRGRPLLAVTAALSLAFGGLVLVRAPGDLMTLALYVAAYGLLLGALRIAVAMRLDSPQLI